jgi:hypothetical protein
MREEGTHGRLRSLAPCRAPATRTTLLTGKLPYQHGVRSEFERRILGHDPSLSVVPQRLGFDLLFGPLQESRRLSVADRESLSLWEMAEVMGGAALAAGWEIDLDGAGRGEMTAGVWPGEPGHWRELIDAGMVIGGGARATALLGDLEIAMRADADVSKRLEAAETLGRPAVVALSFPGLDRVAHSFLRYARPGEFGDVTVGEIERFGPVLEAYYRHIDTLIGRVMDAWGEESMLFVTSSHGIDPIPLHQRLLALVGGRPTGSGSHERAPEGILFARGAVIRRGHAFNRASIEDVVPTALYALGLPVARDLDGKIRTGFFTPQHTRRHAVAVIDSYEALR